MPEELEFDGTTWSQRVAYSAAGGFAYVPRTAIFRASLADDDVRALLVPLPPSDDEEPEEAEVVIDDTAVEGFRAARGPIDALASVALLRAGGVEAQPDHVLVAHSCECCCGAHPADLLRPPSSGGHGVANPMWATPMWATPMWATPMWATAQGPSRSSARPAAEPSWFRAFARRGQGNAEAGKQAPSGPRVVVLDTGLASAQLLPPLLSTGAVAATSRASYDHPDANGDKWLDPVAGHGTFIAGIIERIAPGCAIEVHRVITPQGDASETAVVATINAILAEGSPPAFLNLSFGGAVWDSAPLLTAAILRAQQLGVVVVASAGNDGTCRPAYPAAIPGVVSVGAVGPLGPPRFTNYGSWVRACAPGVDIVSSFFTAFDGREVASGGQDIDLFRSWATWSGTSFAAPAVVGALAREMRVSGCTPAKAVERLIDAPHLGRIPGLGTVVNV